MIIDFSLPPGMNAAIISKQRGSDQLRSAAQILDAIGNSRIHADFVPGYTVVASSILGSVRARLDAAVKQAFSSFEVTCRDIPATSDN